MSSKTKRPYRQLRGAFKRDLYEKSRSHEAFALALAETCNNYTRTNDLLTLLIATNNLSDDDATEFIQKLQVGQSPASNYAIEMALSRLTATVHDYLDNEFGFWQSIHTLSPEIFGKYAKAIPLSYAVGDAMAVIVSLNDTVINPDDIQTIQLVDELSPNFIQQPGETYDAGLGGSGLGPGYMLRLYNDESHAEDSSVFFTHREQLVALYNQIGQVLQTDVLNSRPVN